MSAAHDLLRDAGIEGVSGKAIAARAGVSLSTIYNLFGSKDAVLVAVYEDDLRQYETLFRARSSLGALDRLFDAVDVAMEAYAADPDFYRAAMWRRAPGEALDAAIRRPRTLFWEGLVRNAVASGDLCSDTEVEALARLLVYVFGGALADWIAGEVGLHELHREVIFGFATVLRPFAASSTEKALEARLHSWAELSCG